MAAIFFLCNCEVKICNIPLNSVKLGLDTPDVALKCYVLGYNISILGNNIPKFMLLVAILFLCKLRGQKMQHTFEQC